MEATLTRMVRRSNTATLLPYRITGKRTDGSADYSKYAYIFIVKPKQER